MWNSTGLSARFSMMNQDEPAGRVRLFPSCDGPFEIRREQDL